MREIKFRAWNIGEKEMIDLKKITPFALAIDPTLVGAGIGIYIPDYPDLNIMQYTGLNDKNGKEIYEGDIIKSTFEENTKIAAVEWEDSGFFADKIPLYVECEFDCEVIGNIHQNPNFLK